jgi:hypothetical protein
MVLVVWVVTVAPAFPQGLVTITVPASVGFTVPNVSVSTTASPLAANVAFSNLVVLPTQTLRMSLMAAAGTFTSPSPGTGIPATKLTWTTSNASGGTGSSGTLSSVTWTQFFQSNALVLSGGVDVRWVLQPPGGGIRSGSHTLTVRYRLEAL